VDGPSFDVALPPGTEAVVGVYVNSVPRREEDYEVLPDRVRIAGERTVPSRPTSALGKLLLWIGVGVYPKGDTVDLEVRRHGRTDVVQGRPLQ
jgi:hypothetical protein